MKGLISVALAAALISTLSLARGGYGNKANNSNQNIGSSTYLSQAISTYPIATLTQNQIDDLLFMFEEEKMARDVYITLGEKWQANVFLSIQKSEQKHMDAIKALLERYSIDVPSLENEVGLFENEQIQALYNELIEKGSESLEEAYGVGVTIEEVDIDDLNSKIVDAPEDIKAVYSNLLAGSNNHLKAFNRVLEALQNGNLQPANPNQNQGKKGRM
jgi:hypothetical protein